MKIEEWEERYRTASRPVEDLQAAPSPLLVDTVSNLAPGDALDLACGTGRNSIWLAEHGWNVTAVDGAPAAIEVLKQRARAGGLQVKARVADLETAEFRIPPAAYDLVCKCYYLQRSLFPALREGLRPGGIAIVIVHVVHRTEEITPTRAAPGELRSFFVDWDVLHYREGRPLDPTHQRAIAEIVAHKPA
jgi:SAM-dependent methyltransferase